MRSNSRRRQRDDPLVSLDLIRGEAAEALFGPHYNVAPMRIDAVARPKGDARDTVIAFLNRRVDAPPQCG